MKNLVKFVWAMVSGGSVRSLGLYGVLSVCTYISYLEYVDYENAVGYVACGIFLLAFWLFNAVSYIKKGF